MIDGRSEIRRILNENFEDYKSLLASVGGDFDSVFPNNPNFRDSILEQLSSNRIITSDPITSKIINPDLDEALALHSEMLKLAEKSTDGFANTSIEFPIEHLNAITFTTRFKNIMAYELGITPSGTPSTGGDSRGRTLSILFGLIDGKVISDTKGGKLTMLWCKSRGFIRPQSGQHRALARYLLGIPKFHVSRCIIV